MIKGKFYAGLPSEMMARESTRNVNRMESHFFWPDETDLVSVEPRSKRTISKAPPITTNNNNQTDIAKSDIKPKELVRKQLSSGIQFYDNVNAKTPEARRRHFKKIDNINLNNNNDSDFQPEKKKLETFSSKIEFYDFEHENNAKNGKPVNNNTRNVEEMQKDEIKPKNEMKSKNESPDVSKKRISFRTDEKATEKTKGILKNNEEKSTIEKVLVKPLPKRGLLPKNLSKSVENISKLAKDIDEIDTGADKKPEKLSTIIKEVKNLNLSSQKRNQNSDERDYERDSYGWNSDRIEPRRNNMDYDHHADRYESRGYRDEEYRYRNEERSRNEPYRYNDRYDDYHDRGDRGYVERRYERSQKVSYPQPRDTIEYRDRPRRYEESPIRSDRRSPNYDRHDYGREYEREPKRTAIRDSKPAPRKSIDSYYDEPPSRTVRHEEEEYSTCISQKPKHIPQHLRTNILFNGRVGQQTQRPMSVRNSAVTRVGVGLPDYE
ncbi:uncharacterized protein LOC129567291 [Sitodiplosis mosellana]|uniref:uncharacterized protein LOC129567291 n=1 Tax=Sitodiplosis mosellana TaxID=263140 RepID=UPI0024441AD9|nr:uncharacterized protein LOC129567291 [Sitodiplosis mosellana]